MADLTHDEISDSLEIFLTTLNKHPTNDSFKRLVNLIFNLDDAPPAILPNGHAHHNSTKEMLDKNTHINDGYNLLHLALATIFGLLLGFIIGNHEKFTPPKELTFKENVLQKFGKDASPSILYLHHRLMLESQNSPTKIFVAAEDFYDLNEFNKNVVEIFKEFNVKPSVIDVTPEISSAKLFHEFTDIAFATSRPLIIINDVHYLKGLSPLTIQRIVDPDTAPSKNASMILTASGMTFPEGMTTKKECEIFVRKYLLDTWSSDELSEEQTEPIISRCTGVVVCLPATKELEL